MNYRTLNNVNVVAMCVALFVPGALWYCVWFLCLFYAIVGIWLGVSYERRHLRRRR